MFCPRCGREAVALSRFCASCGFHLQPDARPSRPFLLGGMMGLNFIVAAFGSVVAALFVWGSVATARDPVTWVSDAALVILISGWCFATGLGLAWGKRWGWLMQIALLAACLFLFPWGTLIAGVLLWFFSRPAIRDVFERSVPAMPPPERAAAPAASSDKPSPAAALQTKVTESVAAAPARAVQLASRAMQPVRQSAAVQSAQRKLAGLDERIQSRYQRALSDGTVSRVATTMALAISIASSAAVVLLMLRVVPDLVAVLKRLSIL